MRKITILIWAVVILAVINAATIGTILYHNYTEGQKVQEVAINTGNAYNPLNGKFFRQLGFDEAQMDQFRYANSHFRPAAFKITAAIDSLKGEQFTALQKTVPDTILLNRLSDEIGVLHGSLKKETYRFCLQLKNICSAQQLMQLNEAFRPLFINDAINTPFNNRHLNGRGKQFFKSK